MLRFYHFEATELLDEAHPDLDPAWTPKCCWALRHLEEFPVEVNRADYERLLRVPGIGGAFGAADPHRPAGGSPHLEGLKSWAWCSSGAQYFLTCSGRMLPGLSRVKPDSVLRQMVALERPLLAGDVPEQLSLFAQNAG